jgi:hypothetical protein
MSVFVLTNTSGQLETAISQSYDRLIKAYAGPITANSSPSSGFLIQNANKQSGLFVGNNNIEFYKNSICYKEASNLNFNLYTSTCFIVTGNGSAYVFDPLGTVSFGSGGINSSYRGIQSYAINPSLTLTNINSSCHHAIRFLNCEGSEIFNICQINQSGTRISGRCLELFNSTGPSICLSGDFASFNAPINSNFNHFFGGSNYFSGNSYLRGDNTASGSFCFFNCNQGLIGLDVDTCSIFKKNVTINSNALLVMGVGSYIHSQNLIQSSTGCFGCLSGLNLCYGNIYNDSLCIKNYGCISANGAIFTGNACALFRGICTSGFCGILSQGLNLSGNLNMSGSLNICSPPNAIIKPNSICGSEFNVVSTGTSLFPNVISGNTSIHGNLCSFRSGYFSGISSISTSTNIISGNLCNSGVFSNTLGISTSDITGATINASKFVGNSAILNSASLSSFTVNGPHNAINTINGGLALSNSLRTSCTLSGSFVCSQNTPKTYGNVLIFDGLLYSLYHPQGNAGNFNTISVVAVQNSSNHVSNYRLKLNAPLTYPFSTFMSIAPLNYKFNSGYAYNPADTSTAYVSGVVTPSFGFFTNYGVQTNGVYGCFAVGNCYCDIDFVILNTKSAASTWSDLLRVNVDAVVSFMVF